MVWAVLLAGLVFWSVRHDPPTVPEQADIAAALPFLDAATGAVMSAADADGRAVVLHPTEFSRDCRLTPVRPGMEAVREVTVRVRAGGAGQALDAIAKALPAGYQARVRRSASGTRLELYADAGGFVAIDARTPADATVVTLQVSTGCRPPAAVVNPTPTRPPVSTLPAIYRAALSALGAAGAVADTVTEVACPSGGTARTVTSVAVPLPRDLIRALKAVTAGAGVVQAEPRAWAWRIGGLSVVVTITEGSARVSVTVGCR
ncbi:hypothetical protein EV385_2278 [Krasilnikovia cinnamomea]|uniref:Uncharacterized protein n=1 Tax=Krasilnikovia cinnamomea TaxID=349313 RepID=A0A4V2G6Y6_9ACTN|nr:hypothetical protein EV385_2278 [Krasilnikovia cinnamomea]